jgi:hypothetical protein
MKSFGQDAAHPTVTLSPRFLASKVIDSFGSPNFLRASLLFLF